MTPDASRCRALAAVALLLGFIAFTTISVLRALEPPALAETDDGPIRPTRLDYPARSLPGPVDAEDADLPAGEPVIGVQVAGLARAYRLSIFEGPPNHVVNDRLADAPVTVTYCDLTGCARVYTGDGPNLLDVRTGGYHDGLVLIAGGCRYRQDNAAPAESGVRVPFPYVALEFIRTTWGQWRADHPDTDVVTGFGPRSEVGG